MNSSCEKCKYYLQEVCSGVGEVCEDYFETPIIPEEEKSTGLRNVMHQNLEKKVLGILLEADLL